MTLPDPNCEPTVRVERAAEILGLGRRSAYKECNRWLESGGVTGIPALRFGRAIRVPTAPLLAMIGIDVGQEPETEWSKVIPHLADPRVKSKFIDSVDSQLQTVEKEVTMRRANE